METLNTELRSRNARLLAELPTTSPVGQIYLYVTMRCSSVRWLLRT